MAVDGEHREPTTPACHAPTTTMYLTPRGDVQACCFNVARPLGNVGEARLLDIWHGAAAASLRAAVAVGRLDQGCQFCAWQEDEGAVPPSRSYDWLAPADAPGDAPATRWPRRLELALSNRCNLACTMCHGELSSRIRARREHLPPVSSPYDEVFFEDLEAFLPHLDVLALLGGEPTLSPEALRVLEAVARQPRRPEVHVTTNGMQVPGAFAALMEQIPMEFTVSLDGATAEQVERIRVGARLTTILETLDVLQEHCERRGTQLSLAFSLMRETWPELGELLVLAERRGLPAWVNLVATPLASSLHTAPADELDHVVRALERQDAEVRAVLDRNLPVWDEQLARLRQLQARPAGGRRSHASVVVRRTGGEEEPGPDRAEVEAEVALLLGGEDVDRARCDAADVVLEVSPDGFLGVPASWCVGRPMVQVVDAAEVAASGTALVAEQRDTAVGDLRVLRVVGPQGEQRAVARVLVRAAPGGGATWSARWEQAPAGAG